MESKKGFFRGSDGLGCLGGSSANDFTTLGGNLGAGTPQFNAIGNLGKLRP